MLSDQNLRLVPLTDGKVIDIISDTYLLMTFHGVICATGLPKLSAINLMLSLASC